MVVRNMKFFIASSILLFDMYILACQLNTNTIDNGKLIVHNSDTTTNQLEIKCDIGYMPYPHDGLIECSQIKENRISPQCLRECPKIKEATKRANNFKAICEFKNNFTSCDRVYHGIKANLICEDFYEARDATSTVFQCIDGKWDSEPRLVCTSRCGTVHPRLRSSFDNDEDAEEDAIPYPWHIAMYRKASTTRPFCGGTLIRMDVTLSAAHCFFKNTTASNYILAAAKFYDEFNHKNDLDIQQQVDLIEIILHPMYTDKQEAYGRHDIVVLLHKPFNATAFVLPACLDRSGTFKDDSLMGHVGHVSGFGATMENGVQSMRRQVIHIIYRTTHECMLSGKWLSFFHPIVYDKVCAADLDEERIVCRGNSGGGMMFLDEISGRYFLRGIVSTRESGGLEKVCNAQYNALYTSVNSNLEFIDMVLNMGTQVNLKSVNIESIRCDVPTIAHGHWTVLNTNSSSNTIKYGDVVMYSCDEGYGLYPNVLQNMALCQGDGLSYVPECRKRCRIINARFLIETQPNTYRRFCDKENRARMTMCYLDSVVIGCEQAVEGTVGLVSGLDAAMSDIGSNFYVAVCKNGLWKFLIS